MSTLYEHRNINPHIVGIGNGINAQLDTMVVS